MIDYGVNVPNYLECLNTSMFVENIEYGERTRKSGIVIPTETMDYQGHFVRARWAKIKYKSKDINFADVGDWILLKHGHWSTSMLMTINGQETKLWYISPKSIKEGLIAISKTMPKHLEEYGFKDE